MVGAGDTKPHGPAINLEASCRWAEIISIARDHQKYDVIHTEPLCEKILKRQDNPKMELFHYDFGYEKCMAPGFKIRGYVPASMARFFLENFGNRYIKMKDIDPSKYSDQCEGDLTKRGAIVLRGKGFSYDDIIGPEVAGRLNFAEVIAIGGLVTTAICFVSVSFMLLPPVFSLVGLGGFLVLVAAEIYSDHLSTSAERQKATLAAEGAVEVLQPK